MDSGRLPPSVSSPPITPSPRKQGNLRELMMESAKQSRATQLKQIQAPLTEQGPPPAPTVSERQNSRTTIEDRFWGTPQQPATPSTPPASMEISSEPSRPGFSQEVQAGASLGPTPPSLLSRLGTGFKNIGTKIAGGFRSLAQGLKSIGTKALNTLTAPFEKAYFNIKMRNATHLNSNREYIMYPSKEGADVETIKRDQLVDKLSTPIFKDDFAKRANEEFGNQPTQSFYGETGTERKSSKITPLALLTDTKGFTETGANPVERVKGILKERLVALHAMDDHLRTGAEELGNLRGTSLKDQKISKLSGAQIDLLGEHLWTDFLQKNKLSEGSMSVERLTNEAEKLSRNILKKAGYTNGDIANIERANTSLLRR